MKRGLFAFLIVGACLVFFAIPRNVDSRRSDKPRVFEELRPQKIKAVAAGTSPRVDSLGPENVDPARRSLRAGKAEETARAIPNKLPFRKEEPGAIYNGPGPLAQFTGQGMPQPSVSFEGLSSNDNAAVFGFRVFPPDTNGDVGPNHFVQTVNTLFRVYDKQGIPQTPPLRISSLFASLGTDCSTRDDGDPVVLYDSLSDRWMLTQYCKNIPPFRQMIAISKTGDPTGEFYIYEFIMPNIKLNDYSKMGAWHDAYYMSTDEFFGGDYAGSGAFAFERDKMLVGDPTASYIYFDLASPTTIRIGGIIPVDLDGLNAPPLNTPGIFVGYAATEYGYPTDALRLFEFRADFSNPDNSTFAEAAESPLNTTDFDPTSDAGRTDIEQPAPGETLDSQSDRLMYRAAYRNLETHEAIVVNQTVRTSNVGEEYRAGVRLHELRRTPGQAFVFGEQSTIGDTDTNRFMAAAAQDHEGNIAVGYSTSNSEKQPSIVYTGRLEGDTPGTYRSETQLVEGTGVQTAFGFRWGDYSGMVSDPSDGCSFWITNQYYTLASQNESPFGWLTKIGKFRFTECEDEERTKIDVVALNDENNNRIPGAKVEIFLNGDLNTVPSTRITKADGWIDPVWTPAGTHRIVVSARGYITKGFDLTVMVNKNQSWLLNARLTPTAVIENAGIAITSEGCVANGSIEPSEAVTLQVTMKNLGQRDTIALVATLLSEAGVLNPGPAQNYGVLTTAGEFVSRPFSFTVSPAYRCGEEIELRFHLTDGAENLGVLTIPVKTGYPNVVFEEAFDSVTAPDLPAGWSTSFEGMTENWTTTVDVPSGATNAAFSPAPRTIGVNELVSPVISITSTEAELRFRNWYELETTFLRNRVYDGAVLEIEIEGGKWQDILDAGGSFISGGYNDGVIDACCSNPLVGRRAWSGRSGTESEPVWIDSVVRIPASAAGKDIRFRWRVATDNGTFRDGMYIDDIEVIDGSRCDCLATAPDGAPFDFDGDGKTDRGLFKASDVPNAPDYRIRRSSGGPDLEVPWGSVGDIPVNSDYDGDGKTDYAVFRPSTRDWFILQSSDNLFRIIRFGLSDDIPAPADFDGDDKADVTVYRPATGTWYVFKSFDNQVTVIRFGSPGDIPVPADYNGDSHTDFAVFRPSTGVWHVLDGITAGYTAVRFGQQGDKPVVGDFDRDAKADFVLYRPSERNWYLLMSNDGFSAVRFGLENDLPLQADFDGDGKRDIALYRPSSGVWYFISSSDGNVGINAFGTPQEIPVPGIFVRQ
ncbi:MAG: hypothetical protein HKN33_07690 [Pyrinomonadaceae bacterium]|nr:hypothetical protein [Pyrinomonadaceae bacterium]